MSHIKNTMTFNKAAVDVTGHQAKRHMNDDQLIMAIIDNANNGPQCSSR